MMRLARLLAFAMMLTGSASGQEVRMAQDEKGSGVQLTRPDGTPIYVNPHAVAFVRAPLPGELGNAVVVFASGAKQATQETVDEVIDKIELDRPEGP